ncbi:MAG TPA: hypothetical protein VHW01_13250, partial [Polyangiaceae bacterium]|jgi:hypothetical protein|nr:hypothetical protein [Polyangiaceae bacterium]
MLALQLSKPRLLLFEGIREHATQSDTAAGSVFAGGFGGGDLVTVLHPRSSFCRHGLATGAKLEASDP